MKRAVNTSTDAGESNQFFCKLYFAKVFVRIIYYMAIKKPDCCSNKRIDFGRNADISKINNVKQVFRNISETRILLTFWHCSDPGPHSRRCRRDPRCWTPPSSTSYWLVCWKRQGGRKRALFRECWMVMETRRLVRSFLAISWGYSTARRSLAETQLN